MSLASFLGLRKAAEVVKGAPAVPRLVGFMSGEQVVNDPHPALVDGAEFKPGRSYFGLRLAGLHLRDARRFTTELLPLCICLAEFRRAGKPQTVPFSMGPDSIRQKLRDATAGDATDPNAEPIATGPVEIRDVEIIRPTPVTLANVEAFVGLYAVPGDDIARTLLNVIGDIGQSFSAAVAPVIGVAEKVYDGFNKLLGVKGVRPVAETLHGAVLRNSGYLLVTSAPDDAASKRNLCVSGGRLRRGKAPDSPLVTDFDYCLIAVQRRETVVDEDHTAPDLFGEQWAQVISAFEDATGGNPLGAFRRLQATIYGSPDLIARDRDAALAGYLVEYNKATALFGHAPAGDVTRGPVTTVASALSGIAPLYEALMQEPALSDADKARLRSGQSAWSKAIELRGQLADQTPGAVGDAIIRALPADRRAGRAG